jgi:hypothetical protein
MARTYLVIVRGETALDGEPVGFCFDPALCRAAVHAAQRDLAQFAIETDTDPVFADGIAGLSRQLDAAHTDLEP